MAKREGKRLTFNVTGPFGGKAALPCSPGSPYKITVGIRSELNKSTHAC